MRAFALTAATVLLAGACSFTPSAVITSEVRIEVAERANDDSPIALDLVIAFSDQTFNRVLATPADDWFAKRADYLQAYGNDVRVISWEVVPGQTVPKVPLPSDLTKAQGGVFFARYLGKGQQRDRLPRAQAVVVRLGRDTMTLRAGTPTEGESR
jgi:type VI secretion system protein